MIRRAAICSVALLLVACGPSVDDVCNGLEDDCPAEEFDTDECTAAGERLEQAAEDSECDGAFDDYMDCLDDAGCGWRQTCAIHREALDGCLQSRS